MGKKFFGSHGWVIHLATTDDGTKPPENISLHEEVSKRNSRGCFYFSCRQRVAKISELEYLVIYYSTQEEKAPKENRFFVAKVEPESKSFTDPFIPDDAAEFTPEKWASEESRTWFRLSNLREIVNPDELRHLEVITQDDQKVNFLQSLNPSPRAGARHIYGALSLEASEQ